MPEREEKGWYLNNWIRESLGVLTEGLTVGEATKGTRWMPWHQGPMKGVAGCDKPGGAASRL